MMKAVILKESEYRDLKISVTSALYFIDELPASYIKGELKRHLREASEILDREDGENNDD